MRYIPAVLKDRLEEAPTFGWGSSLAYRRLEKALEVDWQVFLPYLATPVIRQELQQIHRDLDCVPSVVEGQLDNAAIQRLNFEVDERNEDQLR